MNRRDFLTISLATVAGFAGCQGTAVGPKAACETPAKVDPRARMVDMLPNEALAVLERAAGPLLEKAGFARVGARWISERNDAIRAVDFKMDRHRPVVLAGIGFVPAISLLKKAPPELDLSCGTVPPSDLLQIRLTHGVRYHRWLENTLQWSDRNLSTEGLSASGIETFRDHLLPFFEATSTIDAALEEVQKEGKYGDCGPLSRFEPRINTFVLATLHLARGDRDRAAQVVHTELAKQDPTEPWPSFRDWLLK